MNANALLSTSHLIQFLQNKALSGLTKKVGKGNGAIPVEDLAREAYGIASQSNVAKMRSRVGGMVRQAIPLGIVIAVDYGRDCKVVKAKDGTEVVEPCGHPKIKGIKIFDPERATPEDKELLEQNLNRLERRRFINAEQLKQLKQLAGLELGE